MHLKFLLIFFIFNCNDATLQLNRTDNSRIVGGHATTIKKIGGFLVAFRDNIGFFCGGSYIQDRIVLTAAHCLADRLDIIDDLTVEGGVSLLALEKRVKVPVKEILIADHYDPSTNNNDIAIVKLKKSLRGTYIRTIPLCKRAYQKGDIAQISGWGYKDVKGLKPMVQVRTAKLPVMSHTKCKKIYKKLAAITNSMLCAGELGMKDSCTYDSGGPLTINKELCGIVSFGVGCADSVYPGVYANVINLMPFIKKSLHKLMDE